jgi:hypothetical protein
VRIRPRTVLAASMAAAVALAGGAVAAPAKAAPVCNLVKDGKGDAEIVSAQPSLDIVTGDLASDGKSISAVMRLDGPPGGANPQAAGGTRYYFSFSLPKVADAQYLAAFVPFAGEPTFTTGQIVADGTRRTFTNDAGGEVKGKIAGNEITITAPVDAFEERGAITRGTKLTSLTAETFAVVGLLLVGVDEAAGKSYVAGTPSCVKPVA